MKYLFQTKDGKKKLFLWLIILLLTTVSIELANILDTNPPLLHIIGAYVSVTILAILTFRCSFPFFVMVMIFGILSTAGGSILNLYRSIDSYDRMIHFLSGILLAEAGRILMIFVLRKRKAEHLFLVIMMFSATFSFAGAGLWEIYEFTTDQLIGTTMQGSNLNTMGDIVSGFLGGLVYVIGYSFMRKMGSDKTS